MRRFAAIGCVLLASTAWADTPIEALPEALRPIFEQAEAQWKVGELEAAEKTYTRINDEAPTFDRAFRRRCGVVLELGRPEESVELCRKAVELTPSIENRTGLAIALTRRPEGAEGYREELDEARELLTAVTTEDATYIPGWQAMCTWALEATEDAALRSCVETLSAADPENSGTLYFQALRHMADGEVGEATTALRKARKSGLSDAQYQPLALRLGLSGQRPDPVAIQQARAVTQRARGPVSWIDLVPWFLAGGLVLGVGVLLFFADDDEDEE